MSTRAPVRWASTACMSPIGPWPITSTVSSGAEIQRFTPFRTVFTGSTKAACSKGTPSGIAHHAAPGNYPVHDADVLGKPAAGGLKARRDADLLIELALRRSLLAAVVALAAGHVMEDHDALANLEARDALADVRRLSRPSRGRRCAGAEWEPV